MPKVRWSNGQADSAPTWEALEQIIRKSQWTVRNSPDFRDEMAERAIRWSGRKIMTDCTAHEFFLELEYAKLIRIEDFRTEQEAAA